MTTVVLLVICGVSYAVGVGGLALAVGGPIGWALLAVGAGIPAAYLLAKSAEDRSIERDRAEHRGETYRPDAEDAPAPLPPMPAQYD